MSGHPWPAHAQAGRGEAEVRPACWPASCGPDASAATPGTALQHGRVFGFWGASDRWKPRAHILMVRQPEPISGKPEARAEGIGFLDQKREFPQLALRASRHGPLGWWADPHIIKAYTSGSWGMGFSAKSSEDAPSKRAGGLLREHEAARALRMSRRMLIRSLCAEHHCQPRPTPEFTGLAEA